MNVNLNITEKQKTMLSTEIAELTDKRNDHVMRDIRIIIENLKDTPDLGSGFVPAEYKAGNGKREPCYQLDYESTIVVLTGYDVVARTKVIKRWHELEQQAARPLTANEILAQSAMALVEHDKRLAATEIEVKQVAAKVAQISVDLRNGVPHGFISRKNARSIYAKGLSQTIFEEAMTALAVPTKSYVSFGESYSTPTFAYQEDHIPTAVSHFIRDLEQKSPCQCFSRVLNKRVNYVKIPNYGLKELSHKKTENQTGKEHEHVRPKSSS